VQQTDRGQASGICQGGVAIRGGAAACGPENGLHGILGLRQKQGDEAPVADQPLKAGTDGYFCAGFWANFSSRFLFHSARSFVRSFSSTWIA